MGIREIVVRLLLTARDAASDRLGQVRAGITGIRDAVSSALDPLKAFRGLIALALGAGGAKELQERADAYTRLTNSLRVATRSEEEYQKALKTVIDIAKDTRSSLETTAQLYARISQNRKALNLTEQQTADLTALISKGMQLGGASAQEYASATLQLTQALGSGVLRGEEFNAVMEASPELMRRLADGLGVAVGQLRGLAEQGVLTSNIVSGALLSQKDAIDAAYAKTAATVEQRFEQMTNAATIFIGRVNEQTGATRALGEGLQFLTRNLDAVAAVAGAALAASLAKGAQALAATATAAIAARDAARQQAIAAEQQHAANLAAAQGQAAAAQAAYNRALAEQRLAAQIVAAMQAELGYGVTEAELAAARARSAAAAQAATAATERYAAAQAALNAVQAPAAAGAGFFGRALGFLAGPGGLIIAAVSAFGLLYSAFSRQKQPTDDLAQSTERYADSLKALNDAQLNARLQQFSDAAAAQKKAVADAAAEVERYRSGHIGLWAALTETKSRAALLTEAQGKLADETQKLGQIEENREATLKALAEQLGKQTGVSAQQIAQYVQQALAMKTVGESLETLAKRQADLSKAEQDRIQSQLALAQAAGDYQRVEALTIALANERAKAAKEQASLDDLTANAAKIRVDSLKGEYAAYASLTPVQIAALDTAKAEAAQKAKQAEASAALVEQLQGEAKQSQTLQLAKQNLLELASRFKKAQEDAAAAAVLEARATLELARARGDEQKIAEALLLLRQAETRAAAAAVQTQRAELEQLKQQRQQIIDMAGGYDKLTAAKRLEVAQIDQAIEAKQRDIAASRTSVEIKEREARQAERMAGPIGQLIRLYEQRTNTAERETDAVERSYDAKLRDLEVEQKQAEAKGDLAKAAELGIQIAQAEAEKTQAVADAKKAELQAEIDLLDAKKLDVLASEQAAAAKVEELAAIDAKIAKLKDLQNAEQDRADSAAAEAEKVRKAAEKAAEVEKAQAAAAADAERETRRMAAVIGYAAQNFGELSEKGQAALKAINTDPMARAAKDAESLNRAVGQLTQGLDEVAGSEIAFNERLQALVETAAGVGPEADRARRQLVAMAQQGMSGIAGITGAGEQAIDTLNGIRDAALEAKDALGNLADDYEKQILQIQGDKKTLEQLDYEDQLRKLEELRQKSGQEGQREFEEAKARAEQLHNLKLKQIADEERAKRQPASGPANANGAGSAGSSSPNAGGATYNITNHNTFQTDPSKLATEEWWRREIQPVQEKVSRLRR